ncbi:ROK family protein [Rhizohabitans arisaemae]|uniref:ROK family protein n=1 Tax=Rhizohabitans arisaemae TaxID=2720610 RepID=UPI0024B0FCAE|nr:ROK family protein [Rhizohabitans arisaemae]
MLRALMARPGHNSDIAKRSGVSPSSVSQVVGKLRAQGIVLVKRSGRENRVRLAKIPGIAVGVEVGFGHTVVVARRFHQEYTEAKFKDRLDIGADSGLPTWVDWVTETIVDLAEEFADGTLDVGTVGLGIPRIVNPEDQRLTPPLLPPWSGDDNPALALQERLHEVLPDKQATWPLPKVQVDNDANLGALAESVYKHADKDTLLYIKSSTGIGAGIIIGGKVHRGKTGTAGEIGHMMVDPGGAFCQCGGRGCLETLAGANAMLRQAAAALGRSPQELSLTELIDKARNGDAVCDRVLREAATALGQAVGNLCNVLSLDAVVIGGTLGTAGELVLGPCWEGVRRTAMAAACQEGFKLDVSRVDNAVAHGALLLGIDKMA